MALAKAATPERHSTASSETRCVCLRSLPLHSLHHLLQSFFAEVLPAAISALDTMTATSSSRRCSARLPSSEAAKAWRTVELSTVTATAHTASLAERSAPPSATRCGATKPHTSKAKMSPISFFICSCACCTQLSLQNYAI